MARKSDKRTRGRREKSEFDQKVLDLARVTRVVKGGRRFRFRATIVIGDHKGRVGVGVSKGADVSVAIQKATQIARKNLITIPLKNTTIPHDVSCKYGSAKILLKPAPEGHGVIAGGAVRVVLMLAGVHDVISKSLGASNKINVARATVACLSQLRLSPDRMIEKKVPEANQTTA